MQWSRFIRTLIMAAGLAVPLLAPGNVAAQTGSASAELSLDSLLNTHISSASKYLQTSAQAGASITILTGQDIRRQGYRNMQDVLESVPGMYITYDRNYPSLGTRGFGRASDYNNRVLVLMDGHTLNESLWGSAPVGADLGIDLDAIERIEIVRGPGSALYGTNAMFAVINIVTRTGTQLDGFTADVRTSSGRERQATITGGHPLGTFGSYALSALVSKSDGGTLYFPEFDTPANHKGVVRGLDWEHNTSLGGSLVLGDVTLRAGYRAHAKGIPTASYGVLFGDPRAKSTTESGWANLSAHRDIGFKYHVTTRVYGDVGRSRGVFPFTPGPVYDNGGGSAALGFETNAIYDLTSQDRITIGAEGRRVSRANYFDQDVQGRAIAADRPFTMRSVYAQNEWQIAPRFKVIGGLRYDAKLTRWQSLVPRVALIANPDRATTFKLLYGEAYRAPSVGEADLSTNFFSRDTLLRSERVRTAEIVVERRVTSIMMAGLSLYHYRLNGLIEQVAADTVAGVQYRNGGPTHGRGVELSLTVQSNAPVSVSAWYAVQHTLSEAFDDAIVNSPHQMANIAASLRSGRHVTSALTLRHETRRRTLEGGWTSGYTRADMNVDLHSDAARQTRSWLSAVDVSLHVMNLLNTTYAFPGGSGNVQPSIQQNGRAMTLRFGVVR